MTKPTQANQACRLATPFDEDTLLMTRFEGSEGLGELFEWRVEALSQESSLQFREHIGKFVSFHLDTEDGVGRDFGGVLTEARNIGLRNDLWAYQLILRPWPWLHSLQIQSRIFENKTPDAIILEVLGSNKFSRVDNKIGGQYPKLEYTVQYRETDLNFALRLMEKFGIYYYFRFDPQQGSKPADHYLVLADAGSHVPQIAPKSVRVVAPSGSDTNTQKFLYWGETESALTDIFFLRDYNYRTPNADLTGISVNGEDNSSISLGMLDYPGGQETQAQGDELARVMKEAEAGRGRRAFATGYAPSLLPGHVIPVTSDFRTGDDYKALILRCFHSYGNQQYASAGGDGEGPSYSGSYELAPEEQSYRMPLRTRRPVIVGTQSAKVVADVKKEIEVDDQGRIFCEFYWAPNEYTPKGQPLPKKHSRRVRVAQFWAGSLRGSLFLPRVGDEVVVQYEEGDPDRPLVVGSVYNGVNPINKTLPRDQNQSGILTRSTPNSEGYNMLLFDDSVGAEKVKLRSQKDLMFKALANEQRDIGGSQTENIGGDETISVGTLQGGGNFTLNAIKKVTINVGPSKDAPLTQLVMDNDKITLSVGPGGQPTQILMDKTGVTIKGPTITINGVALVTASAAMVKINS